MKPHQPRVPTHHESAPLFEVFGDESQCADVVTFGMLMVPSAAKDRLLVAVGEAKEEFGGSPVTRVHCRELFAGDARAKSSWMHLSKDQCFALCRRLAECVNRCDARCWLGYIEKSRAPRAMAFAPAAGLDQEKDLLTVELETEKQFVQFAYMAAVGPVFDLLPPRNVTAWLDPDRSITKWFGKRRQARMIKGFFPLAHKNFRFEPARIDGEKPLLLDLADILAYCGAHALCAGSGDRAEHEAVMHILRPGLSYGHFGHANAPDAMLSVEANGDALKEFREHLSQFGTLPI